MNLRVHLPSWLINPAFVFMCMCGGLALLYLSHKQQLQRILARPSGLVGVEQYQITERPGWLLPLLCVVLAALLVTPLLALFYSLTYKGTMPPLVHISSPPVCKTVDCFPSRQRPRTATPSPVINAPQCPNGICSTAPNFGVQTVNNGDPLPKFTFTETSTPDLLNDGWQTSQVSIHVDRTVPSAIIEVDFSGLIDASTISSRMLNASEEQISYETKPSAIRVIIEHPTAFLAIYELMLTVKARTGTKVTSITSIR